METLDEQSTADIFSNIEDILLTNTVGLDCVRCMLWLILFPFKTFLSTLEERQRDCRLYVDHIGDLLERHMPNMRVYLVWFRPSSLRYSSSRADRHWCP
jgi:hypothetical protein